MADKKGGRPKEPSNFEGLPSGDTNERVLRRLARDAPEMLDKIEAGELSVNAAAIQAGIIHAPAREVQASSFAGDMMSPAHHPRAREVQESIDTTVVSIKDVTSCTRTRGARAETGTTVPLLNGTIVPLYRTLPTGSGWVRQLTRLSKNGYNVAGLGLAAESQFLD